MNFDTPLVEYLIIGTHTFSWLILLLLKAFNIPINSMYKVDAAYFLFLLPLFYLIGMIFDDISFQPLAPLKKKIQKSVYKTEHYNDEFIAFHSKELFSAYEAKVRRIRILGAAIFNWPLLGISTLLYIDTSNLWYVFYVAFISAVLCLTSFTSWKNLYKRAYVFKKEASEVIKQHKDLEFRGNEQHKTRHVIK